MIDKNLLINPAVELNDEYCFGDEVEYVCPKIEHNIRPKWNQGNNKETESACTIVWAVNQLIRLFWLDLTPEQTDKLYIEVVKYATNYWYIIGTWWYIPTATNVVCKWWNEIWYKTFKEDKVFWTRVDWNSPKVEEALKNGHIVWFGKELSWRSDAIRWMIDKDTYPKGTGHRLNYKCAALTKATSWIDKGNAEIWVYDNYYGSAAQEFFILNRKKYIFKWIYGYCYIIMPESCMKSNIEAEKERIALLKAVNAVIAVLTSTWWDLPEAYQELSASYASALRDQYPDARKLEKDHKKKIYQSLVDFLSYSWKYLETSDQAKIADLAKYMREKYKLL